MSSDPAPRLVVLRPCAEGFEIAVEPPLPDGDHRRSFRLKDEAWRAASLLWSDHRLGLNDLTDGNTGRNQASE